MMISTAPTPALNWCLFLDVDGTLIELTETPWQTAADDEIKKLLPEVAARLDGAVALVSGREIRTLDQLFGPLHLALSGLHGLERRKASGELQGSNFSDPALGAARATLQALIDAHPGTLLEDKGQTIAVHYRLAPRAEAAMRAAATRLAAELGAGYHVQEGSMLFEIKPRDVTKATPIAAFMQEPPFRGRVPVFIGDDLTDRDGFRMVEALGGLSIGVGERVRGQHYLPNVGAVRQLLRDVAAL